MSAPDERRAGFLAEMGLGPIWMARAPAAGQSTAPQVGADGNGQSESRISFSSNSAESTSADASAGAGASAGESGSANAGSGASENANVDAARLSAPVRSLETPSVKVASSSGSSPDIQSAWDNAVALPTVASAEPRVPALSSNGQDSGRYTADGFESNDNDELFGQVQPAARKDVAGADFHASQVATMDWEALQSAVSGCTRCGLCKSRTKTVFGTGDRKARWLFIGEGPGRNEDLQGEPFVGPAGKLLDNMLGAMKLRRGENAYIANIVKCRPTGADGRDRPPEPDEVAACMPYLERQIALLQPTLIVALGKTAAVSLLDLPPSTTLSGLRGKMHQRRGLPMVATFHPAYLLRKLADKARSWADLCMAMAGFAAAGRHTEPQSPANLFESGAGDDN